MREPFWIGYIPQDDDQLRPIPSTSSGGGDVEVIQNNLTIPYGKREKYLFKVNIE